MSVVHHDSIKDGSTDSTSEDLTRSNQFAGSNAMARAAASCRKQLVESLQQKVELLQLCSSLTAQVSSLKIALAKANQLASYDELTGLANRRLLLDRFINAAALAKRHRQVLALLFFDVNDFKRVNDELGHDAGDKLLQRVATRLSSSIRSADTACRYGGDEFVILLTEIDHLADVVAALKKIRAELAPPYEIDRHSIRLTLSDGLAIYPNDGQHFTDLMRLADCSMFSNKSGHRRQFGGVVPTTNIFLRDAEREAKAR